LDSVISNAWPLTGGIEQSRRRQGLNIGMQVAAVPSGRQGGSTADLAPRR
jgi:hypothetical protein